MPFSFSLLSVIPLRASAAHTAEQVSQILFGEVVEVLQTQGAWQEVRCTWDNYTGWAQAIQLQPLAAPYLHADAQSACAYTLDIAQPVLAATHYVTVTMGATLPQYDGLNLQIDAHRFAFNGQAVRASDYRDADWLLKIARRYLGAPYQWGGRSPFGIDCSGFTQMVFLLCGFALPRDAALQVSCGTAIDFAGAARSGDLVFFENTSGKIVHVGILLDQQTVNTQADRCA